MAAPQNIWYATLTDRVWYANFGDRVPSTWDAGSEVTGIGQMCRNTLTKMAGDTVALLFDFGDMPELAAGDTIASLTSILEVGTSDLTITAKALAANGYQATAKYAGGNAGTNYTVACTILMTSGIVLTRNATLKVV